MDLDVFNIILLTVLIFATVVGIMTEDRIITDIDAKKSFIQKKKSNYLLTVSEVLPSRQVNCMKNFKKTLSFKNGT